MMRRKSAAHIALAAAAVLLGLAGHALVADANSRRTTADWTSAILADGIQDAITALQSTDKDDRDLGKWLREEWRGFEHLATWDPGRRALTPWLRLLGHGIDSVIAMVDPSGYLPRIGLPMYHVPLVRPLDTEITSEFGYRDDPIRHRRRYHKGLDFHAPRGTPIHAAASGIVRMARRWGTYGRIIIIDHGDGVETRYAHLSRYRVSEGDHVDANEIIGLSGSTGRATGPHLHFEVRLDGRAVDPRKAFVDRPEVVEEPAKPPKSQEFPTARHDSGVSLKPGS